MAEELRDRLEAELDPEPLEAVQLLQEGVVVHGRAANPPARLKVGPAAALTGNGTTPTSN